MAFYHSCLWAGEFRELFWMVGERAKNWPWNHAKCESAVHINRMALYMTFKNNFKLFLKPENVDSFGDFQLNASQYLLAIFEPSKFLINYCRQFTLDKLVSYGCWAKTAPVLNEKRTAFICFKPTERFWNEKPYYAVAVERRDTTRTINLKFTIQSTNIHILLIALPQMKNKFRK